MEGIISITFDENGKAKLYDDTFDISIHCESEEEKNKVLEILNNKKKTGHWITAKDEYGDIYEAVCSCCDKNGVHKYNYCPWCGARMEVENE